MPSVRAEAANSVCLFGPVSAAHLVQTAVQDDHWLVYRSILAALSDLECSAELLKVCLHPLGTDEDETVQAAAIDALASLAHSSQRDAALDAILSQTQADLASLRTHAAAALKQFSRPEATAALVQLCQDPDHGVAGAALENLLP